MKNGNTGIVILIIALFLTVIALCGVILYSNLEDNNSMFGQNNNENSETNNEQQVENDNNSYMVSTSIGRILIFKTGDVYLIPPINKNITIPENIGIYGKYSYGEFLVKGSEIKDEFNGYKLKLSNIRTVYYFDNAQSGKECALFIDANGNLSALNVSTKDYSFELINNLQNNITSIAIDNSMGTTKAILFDKLGNKYFYYAGDTNCKEASSTIQVLYTNVGEIILDNIGNVYYIPSILENYWGTDKLNIISTEDFTYGKNIASGYKTLGASPYFYGYKVNVSDVQCMYEAVFGNGMPNVSIILVHKDGKISELTFTEAYDLDKVNVTFSKHISNYSNIVSVIQYNGFGGNYAKLVNKQGNLIDYFGIDYK